MPINTPVGFKIPPTDQPNGIWSQNYFGRLFGTNLILFAAIPIGIWNMQANEDKTVSIKQNTTNYIAWTRILNVWLTIYNDAGDKEYYANLVNNGIEECSQQPDLNQIYIKRVSGGFFDSADFSSTDVPRGLITICYLG